MGGPVLYIPFVCVSHLHLLSIRGTWLLHIVIQLWAGVTDIFIIVCNGKLLQSFVVVWLIVVCRVWKSCNWLLCWYIWSQTSGCHRHEHRKREHYLHKIHLLVQAGRTQVTNPLMLHLMQPYTKSPRAYPPYLSNGHIYTPTTLKVKGLVQNKKQKTKNKKQKN